jgi:hypothetical protein
MPDVIVTLANVIAGNNDITAWCLDCRHHADLSAVALALRLGEDFPALALAERKLLRCKRCGSRRTSTRLAYRYQPFSEAWKGRPWRDRE